MATTKEYALVLDDDCLYSREEIENWSLDAQPLGCSITSPSKILNKTPFVGTLDNGRAQVIFFFFFFNVLKKADEITGWVNELCNVCSFIRISTSTQTLFKKQNQFFQLFSSSVFL